MLSEKIKDMFYDYYNHRWRKGGIVGTLTTCMSHNGSGTFWIIVKNTKNINKQN